MPSHIRIRFPGVFLVCSAFIFLSACEPKDAAKVDTHTDQVLSDPQTTDMLQWVYIDNGAVQCETSAQPLSRTHLALQTAGIEVHKSQCATITGTAVATLCGLKDLGIHMHQIAQKSVAKARALGYEPMTALSHYGDKSYEPTPCPVNTVPVSTVPAT